MADKIELDLVSNLSETNSITASVSTFGTTDSRINLFRRESIEISSTGPSPARCSCKSKCCSKTLLLIFIHMVIMVMSVAAIALSVLTATYYFEMMNERESEMQQLMERITALENATSQTVNGTEVELQQSLTSITTQIESNRVSIQLLSENVNNMDYAHFVDQVTEMLSQTSRDLRDNVSQLTNDINSNLGSIRTLSGFITDLDGEIQEVHEEIDILAAANKSSTSTNPFKNCIVFNEICSGSVLNNIYWRVCSTPFLSLNVTGYTTADMWCDYESNYSGNMVASVLQKGSTDNEVRCKCSILAPDHFRDNFFALPSDFVFTCNLNVRRCPVA